MAPSSPFPGMNPYLESPAPWSEVHSWCIVELARTLSEKDYQWVQQVLLEKA